VSRHSLTHKKARIAAGFFVRDENQLLDFGFFVDHVLTILSGVVRLFLSVV
jgi:hypothetical protein